MWDIENFEPFLGHPNSVRRCLGHVTSSSATQVNARAPFMGTSATEAL